MYWEINKRFATTVATRLQADNTTGNLVWVHDYQLMLFSQFLREALPSARIAYFHHIPWPPYTIYCTLPWAHQILTSMLACDLIGFHVQSYVSNFIDCCLNALDGAYYNSDYHVIFYNNHFTKVNQFPIGCPYEELAQEAREGEPQNWLRGNLADCKIILGCDRLDYTKGIMERLLAFENFLENYPEHINKVVLYQIAVPSREDVTEYVNEKKQIDETVGRINGKFATTIWSPIHYLYRSFPRKQLAGIYRDSDVALITPLRDGMNLVAKEYVACQVLEPGVLILSLLAGAAQELETAILVNPYDIWEVAKQIQRALCMSEAERSIRIQSMQAIVKSNDVYHWVSKFLKAAEPSPSDALIPRPDVGRGYREYLINYLFGHRLCLFITYDGTLAPYTERPEDAIIPPSMRKTMVYLLGCKNVSTTIVSGRTVEDVKKMAQFPGIRYVGSHGLEFEVSTPGSEVHEQLVDEKDLERVKTAAAAIEEAGLVSDGAWIETKGPIMTYHYRKIHDEKKANELVAKATEVLRHVGLKPRIVNRALEGVPYSEYDKGSGILRMLEMTEGKRWFENTRCVFIGDDEADEEAFSRLKGLALTFKVMAPGETLTHASYILSSENNELQALLEFITHVMENNIVDQPGTSNGDFFWSSES
jgi:trehalose 6-phosphate synthase/phosphatase